MSHSCVPRSTTHQAALHCSGVLSRGDGSTRRLSLDVPKQELWARRASYTTPNSLESLSSSYSREPQGSVSQGETAFLHFVRVPLAKDPLAPASLKIPPPPWRQACELSSALVKRRASCSAPAVKLTAQLRGGAA